MQKKPCPMNKLLVLAVLLLLFVPTVGAAGGGQSEPPSADLAPATRVANITIELTPHNPPIVLPSSGGTFGYAINIGHNPTMQDWPSFEVWTEYTLPDGSVSGPVFGPERFQLPSGWSAQRGDMSEFLGADMPPGTYSYTAYLGRFPDVVLSSDSFTFEKQAQTPGWYPQNSGTTDVLSGVDFINAETGWAVGQNTALHTADGGDTWYEQATPTYYSYFAVDFVDTQAGWVVGGFGTILHSADGGQSWTVQDSGYSTGAYTWRDVQFVDANHGWVVGGYSDGFGNSAGIILYTSDGGAHWQTQFYEDYSAFLQAISFVDADNAWVASEGSTVLHTTNGGDTWTPQDLGSGYSCRDVFFVDADYGWIADSYYGVILHTTDGGNTWAVQTIGDSLYIESLFFADANTGWLAGGDNYVGKVLYTADGGTTWQEQYSGDLILFGIDFADELNGWAVGWNGIILHTETGGQQLQKVTAPPGAQNK
jgi:photosystem II stability/assembly factor-like uncharacterized protein